MAAEDARQASLLSSERKLQEAKARLQGATRSALETEDTGFQVLSELSRQREGIGRINTQLQDADENLSGARRLLVQMNRRALLKKAVLWLMVAILIVTLGVVIYFSFIKPKHH
eukprot:TRINITY_DN31982_c0_g1_i1.p1 TRINITY_DN31982_c0_g1~~TRINITY_DN31982_c0_g1_i1.p1  ORF type:complete len:124 (+),score=33.65 TRINITY_DN31982_c0_g1_i1:33-374(+)